MSIVAKSDLNFQGIHLQPVENIDETWLTASQIGYALQYAALADLQFRQRIGAGSDRVVWERRLEGGMRDEGRILGAVFRDRKHRRCQVELQGVSIDDLNGIRRRLQAEKAGRASTLRGVFSAAAASASMRSARRSATRKARRSLSLGPVSARRLCSR